MQYLDAISKNDRMISVRFQGKPFNITVIQVYAPTSNAEEIEEVGKTTRLFRYDLNQIPYDYTVEVRNRLKGLDLIDRVLEELWTEVRDIVQETGSKTIPMEKKCKKAKWLSEDTLQIAVKRREVKGKGEKESYNL